MGTRFDLIWELQKTATDYLWLSNRDLQIPSIEFINNFFKNINRETDLQNLKFVEQDVLSRRQAEKFRQELKKLKTNRLLNYVDSILEKKEILTRKNSLHDFCNSIIWTRFPKSKWALCEVFRKAMPETASLNGRSELQNFLTCFDEGGIVLVTSKQHYSNLMQQLRSSKDHKDYGKLDKLFYSYFFGHGLMEQVRLQNKIFYTSCCVLGFEESFFSLDLLKKANLIDLELAKNLFLLSHDFSNSKSNSWTHFFWTRDSFLPCDSLLVSDFLDNDSLLGSGEDFNLASYANTNSLSL